MKLILSDIKKRTAAFRYRETSPDKDYLFNQLQKDGYVVSPDFVSKEQAQNLLEKVKELHSLHSEKLSYDNNDESDERFYGIDRFTREFDFFIDSPVFEKYALFTHGHRSQSKFLLSNILNDCDNNPGSGGGWHRDSPYSHQFKAFLFLQDVNLENGPFCYIKGSHQRVNIRAFAKCLGLSCDQYRFEDEQVNRAAQELGLEAVQLTCSAGTMVMADTRGLHRGMPIMSGSRIALTNYYFRGSIPSRFGVESR